MQRFLSALVAVTSLFILMARPTEAQENSGQAVEPTAAPQEINERAGHDAPRQMRHSNAPPERAPEETAAPAEAKKPETPAANNGDAQILGINERVKNLSVKGRDLVIRGRVDGNVEAINSNVTIEPGGSIGGELRMTGGHLDNRSVEQVHVLLQSNGDVTMAGLVAVTPRIAVNRPASVAPKNEWFGQQVWLLMLGLIGMAILLVIAPRALYQVANTVSLEPARCLAVGIFTAAGLGSISLVNAGVMHTPLRTVWSPFGFVIATGALGVMAFGWISGMRFVGDMIARRLGQHHSGSLYGRIALGFGAFFLLNALLGGIAGPLGFFGMLAECLVALMGLGAIVVTGFGKESNWLGARMSGSRSWF